MLSAVFCLLAFFPLANGCLVFDKDYQPPERKGSGTKVILAPENERRPDDPAPSPSSESPAK